MTGKVTRGRGFVAAFLTALLFPTLLAAHGTWLGLPKLDLTPASKALVDQNVIDGVGAVKVGDVIELTAEMPVINVGSVSGPGGYITFYVTPGTEVVGASYVNASGAPIPVRNATSAVSGYGISKGWGGKGPHVFDVTANGWTPATLPAACAANGQTAATCNAGLAFIYGDTGIFYSTRADTALYTSDGLAYSTYTNGYAIQPTNTDPWSSIGGAGDTQVHNKWDAVQVNGFGSSVGGTQPGFTTKERTSLTAAAGKGGTKGRGPTPYNAGSPVAGPDSFMTLDRQGTPGPWRRIAYPGSCRAGGIGNSISASNGPANSEGAVFGEAANANATSIHVCAPTAGGFALSEANPLPAGTNAVRFAVGGIHAGETHRVRVRLRITDPALVNVFNFAASGGDSTQDAGGAQGFDNPWRYWMGAPANVPVAGQGYRLGLNKKIVAVNGEPYDGSGQIPVDATIRYRITYANSGAFLQTNVVLSDVLPAQTVSTSNFTVISGPNILPATNPTGGTFSFLTIPVLPGVSGGVIEFDAQMAGTVSGGVITNEARLSSAQLPGPLIAYAQVGVVNAHLDVTKSVEIHDPDGTGAFAIPGSDVIYTIEVTNQGDAVSANSIAVVDPIPPELALYLGPYGGGAAEPVQFLDGTTPSGLACCSSAHVSYSTDNGLSYSYLPPSPGAYNGGITHLRVAPAGGMPAASGGATPSFRLRFRARIE